VKARTRGCELGVDPLPHDALQSHTRTQECKGNVSLCGGPSGVVVHRERGLAALPQENGGNHGAECLRNCAEEEPRTRERAHAVAYPAGKCARQER